MSLILDALNRADHERKNQDVVPGLNTVHSAPLMVQEEKDNRKYGLYIAISFSIIALAASVYWFVSRPSASTHANLSQPVKASAVTAPQSTSPIPTPAPQADEKVQAAADQQVGASIAESKPAESVITPKPTAAVEQLYSAPEAQVASTDPQVNELYTAEEEPVASESIEEPFSESPAMAAEPTHITNTNAGRVTAEPQPSRTFVSITNVQDFNELPWNTKQQIPTISYQRHNFLAGGVSTVVINGQTLGVGNMATASQLVVQEIFEDGVVLKRGNVIFKLRALNGWINM